MARDELKKPCQKCGKKLEISLFYMNREWKAEFFRDAWCKACVVKFVDDKESLKAYCKFNKRDYREECFDWAEKKTVKDFDQNIAYNKMADLNKKSDMYWNNVIKLYFQSMNRIQYYRHTYDALNAANVDELKVEKKEVLRNETGLELEYGTKTYSKNWCGFYTVAELDYLNVYFDGLQRDFKLENAAYIDYAKKVSKASLAMDRAFSDMCEGKPGAEKRYKDFKDIFDQLSQSAKFAEKTRGENDSVGYGSLGELIKKMESTGFLQKPIKFPKDDIDKISEDYRWVLSSVGEEI